MGISYNTSVVLNGLVGYWDAGNIRSYPGSGTTWFDLSGNNINTTLTNGPTYNSANGGNITFDGSNDYASSVSIPNPNGQLTFTIAMNYTGKNAYHNIFDNGTNRPMLWIDTANKLEVSFSTGAGGLTSDLTYNSQNVIITATYNSASTPGIQLYVNGVLVKTTNTQHVSWSNPSTFTLFNRSASQTFDGKVYSMMFHNRILSGTEVKQNYSALRGRLGI